MEKSDRLKLLSGDASLSNLAEVRRQRCLELSSRPTTPSKKSSVLHQTPDKPDLLFNKSSVARSYCNFTADTPQIYCPIQAISRLPYRHFKGELSHIIAHKFFDDGKFWQRTWTLYYVYPPADISSRPLLLVPANEVQQLVYEINAEFSSSYEIPSSVQAGLMIPFVEIAGSMPQKLGCCTSREMKENLIAEIPSPVGSSSVDKPMLPGDTDIVSLHTIFREWMDAAVDATKSKTKVDRASKKNARIRKRCELVRAAKRAHCYFGLRPRYSPESVYNSFNSDTIGKEYKIATSLLSISPIDPAMPVPYDFADEPIFISIDVEADEFAHDRVTEVGLSILDTLDLKGCGPFEEGNPWFSRIRSRHFRIAERSHIVNNKFLAGCPNRFDFGRSEFPCLLDTVEAVEACFRPPYSAQVPMGLTRDAMRPSEIAPSIAPYKLRERNLVLVGHNVDADISYLRNLGCPIFSSPLQQPSVDSEKWRPIRFLESLDTAHLFQLLKREASPRSLAHVLHCLDVASWNLHNAGNDARYTMHALVAIVVKSRLIDNEILDWHDTANSWWPFGSPTLCEARENGDGAGKNLSLAYKRAWEVEVERRLSEAEDDQKKYIREDCESWELATGWKGDDWVDELDFDGGRGRGRCM